MAQADALAGTLDEAGDVGADEACALTHRHDAQRRHQRGKVVVCNFRLCGADGRDEGGLAHVGEADEAHIRDELQLESYLNVLAGHTGLCELGDLAGGGGKVCIAVAAASSLGDGDGGVVGQVGDDKAALGVLDDRPQRHLDDEVLGILAVAEACAALAALVGGVLALITEVHQSGEVVVHDEDDVAAPAAVAAVRAAGGHELLTMEAHSAVAALAGMEPDGGDVDKIGLCCHTGPPVLRKNSSQRLFSALLFENNLSVRALARPAPLARRA